MRGASGARAPPQNWFFFSSYRIRFFLFFSKKTRQGALREGCRAERLRSGIFFKKSEKSLLTAVAEKKRGAEGPDRCAEGAPKGPRSRARRGAGPQAEGRAAAQSAQGRGPHARPPTGRGPPRAAGPQERAPKRRGAGGRNTAAPAPSRKASEALKQTKRAAARKDKNPKRQHAGGGSRE